MKSILTVLFLLIFSIGYGQTKKLDSTRVVYDKFGNVYTKQYYSSENRGTLVKNNPSTLKVAIRKPKKRHE